MPFTHERYSEVRPFLYHVTARENLDRIRCLRRLESAATLLRDAGDDEHRVRTRRTDSTPLSIDSKRAILRDQTPLRESNIDFEDGWRLEDVVEELNSRVFFWSGWEHGPIRSGKNHFARYRTEKPIVIRTRFRSLLAQNLGVQPCFCKFNSGAPRQYQGRKSPRGSQTFLPAGLCTYTCGIVAEVTFLDSVRLPDDSQMSDCTTGPWSPLS